MTSPATPRVHTRQPIEHGTMRGWRQHLRRKEAPCTPCLDAKRADNQKPRQASGAQQTWNRGHVGQTVEHTVTPVIERCTVDGCGTPATGAQPDPRMVRVHVHGSTEPARWYCRGRCRAIGQALAELRAIRTGVAA